MAEKETRNRKRVKGSWRDKGKGDCFTTKNGQVVCEGSKGMKYKRNKDKNDAQLLKDYGGYSVNELNAHLDRMKGTNSKGGGSKASKIRKIYKHGGRLKKKPAKSK